MIRVLKAIAGGTALIAIPAVAALAQGQGHPLQIGNWQFLNYTSSGMQVCEIKHAPSAEGWWLQFAGKGKTDTPYIGHTNMHVPIPVDTLLTLTVDNQPVRVQVFWVSRVDGGFGLRPVDREKYLALVPTARSVSINVPGVGTASFRLNGTSEAFQALSNCH